MNISEVSHMDRKETYRIAIEAEIMSQNVYRAMAKSFALPEASSVFLQLIPYEEMHEAKMRELFAKEFPNENQNFDKNLMPNIKHVKIKEPKDVLDFAISREEQANSIYISLAAETSDPAVKELLLSFAQEEENHKVILFTEIQRLQGMIQWFDPSELSGIMED